MAISRAVATNYLSGTFSALFAAASESSYEWPIDQALRLLGVSEADLATATVADSERLLYFAALDYYAALLTWRRLTDKALKSSLAPREEDGRSMVDAAAKLLKDAQARATALGLSVGDALAFSPTPLWTEPTVEWAKLSG